jgi:hypothetical protein
LKLLLFNYSNLLDAEDDDGDDGDDGDGNEGVATV